VRIHLKNKDIEVLYSKRAKRYDFSAALYYLIGLRMNRYRNDAVNALHINQGDSVLEVACGTGLNFNLILEKIGKEGYLEGIDYTQAMLDQAAEKINQKKWNNVELLKVDAAEYSVRKLFDAVICTFGLSIIPDYKEALTQATKALKLGGRIVVSDVKPASGVIRVLNPISLLITKPFGINARKNVWKELKMMVKDFSIKEYYFGYIYVASGTKQ
jgi:demethylmenaquinone methyltransferase/2-methoxy-6-polyprenyl-1,4-benzoquinol methylase